MKSMHGIIWLDSVDSTNEEAKRRLHDIDNLSVLSAKHQTSGRGQRGNVWSSEAGQNLTFSMILDFSGPSWKVKAFDQFVISEIAAISVKEFLGSHGIDAEIKWPNDIYVGSDKICGILIENSLIGSSLTSSIIGIGLNVNQTDFPEYLPNPTSMSLCSSRQYDIKKILVSMTEILRRNFRKYLEPATGYAELKNQYLESLWRKDKESVFVDNRSGIMFKGMIRDVSDMGLLIIENMEKGGLREYAFKEISHII